MTQPTEPQPQPYQPQPYQPQPQQPIYVVHKSNTGKVILWLVLTFVVFIPLAILLVILVTMQLA